MTLRFRLAVGALAAALGLLPGFIPPASIFAQSPPATGETIPDLDGLIRDMREKGPRCHGEMGDFTLTFTFFHRKFEKNGKTRESSKSFEVFAPESYRNRKSSFRAPILLIAEDGTPVAPDKLAKERENLTRELDEFERDPNKSAKKKKGTAFYVSPGETKQYAGFTSKQGLFAGTNILSPSLILEVAEFGAGKREMLDGRETVAVEFRVRPGLKFDKPVGYVAQLEGIVWIDVRDRTLVRLEGWQRTPGKGTAFLLNPRPAKAPVLYEQVRVADGVWFPRRSRLSDDATTTMFASLENAEVGVDYDNYRRFRSEITVTDDEEK
jgi:hypothetical protein